MIEGEDKNGKYREYIVIWSDEQRRYIEVEHDSPEGKIVMEKLFHLNIKRKRRREKA